MKKTLFGKRLFYIILLLSGIFLLSCKLLYEMEKTALDSEQADKFSANETSNSEVVIPDDVQNGSEYVESESEAVAEERELTQEEIVEEIISEQVCKRLREVDFTIKEYPIDTEVYTEEMDREYKEVFLQVLLNQIPVQYEDGEENYFEEISPYLRDNSDQNYIKILKKAYEYYYFDFDGDGLPELVIESRGRDVHFGGSRIWKYDADSKRVYNIGEYRWTGWKPLGSGKLYYKDQSSAGMIKYGYQEINSLGDIVREVDFFLMFQGLLNTEWYTISVDEFEDVEIDKESGYEILHDFFEAIDNAVTGITFDELFSDIEHP
ncbi:MAG: hypothetical protein K2O59_14725 [Lachnospiraceae bacterium]|nr:hypothetical protein [Lachnospiraceae bacterium]